MRNADRLRHLYADRRALRQAAKRARQNPAEGGRLELLKARQADNAMQLTIARRRLP
jgi:hypothetical protein